MLVTPRISEKSYKLAAGNVYVFDVPLDANKAEVTAAVLMQYPDIKIKDVRLVISKGKVVNVADKRIYKRNDGKTKVSRHFGNFNKITAQRRDSKKAYVTVSEGKIEIAGFS
jgi:ribosomal protein L23